MPPRGFSALLDLNTLSMDNATWWDVQVNGEKLSMCLISIRVTADWYMVLVLV